MSRSTSKRCTAQAADCDAAATAAAASLVRDASAKLRKEVLLRGRRRRAAGMVAPERESG